MRAIKKSFEQTLEHYKIISDFENENKLNADIENGLSSIFLLSQNLPVREVSDFFSGENFSLIESFEEFETSYQLIKYGFYKQAMVSLRIGFEIGLFSVYWSIIGKESSDFKKWISSKLNTPYKNQKFFKILKSNESIEKFDSEFSLFQEIKDLDLSDFVHTKGVLFSNFGDFQRTIKGRDKFYNFKEWLEIFRRCVKILEILHLLKFPNLNLRFSTDFLLSKFGTIDNIPLFGGGYGDEMHIVPSFISSEQKAFIEDLANSNEEVIYIKKWLNDLPDLTEKDIKVKIINEQKQNIIRNGFNNWLDNFKLYDDRITDEIVYQLKIWAKNHNNQF